jgi:hypothetical protein
MVKDDAKKELQEVQQKHAAALGAVQAELTAALAALADQRATHARQAEELHASYQSEASGTIRWVRLGVMIRFATSLVTYHIFLASYPPRTTAQYARSSCPKWPRLRKPTKR